MFYAIANIVESGTNKAGQHNIIPDTLLKSDALNTNKTGHHVLRYTWHIVEKWH